MSKLTAIQYWEATQASPVIDLDKDNIVRRWIESNLDFSNIKNCIEIGCYPGRYLSVFAEKGIEVNGLDYIPRVKELRDMFKSHGYNTGEFVCGDFLNINIDRKYDCVISLGFIEHFQSWENVLVKHISLLSDEGTLVIETPNFRGWMQWLPRFFFDRDNLKRHNVQAINLEKWRSLLLKHNMTIVYAGYFGEYLLWFESNIKNRYVNLLKKITLKSLMKIRQYIFTDKRDDKSFSAAMGIIATKRKQALQNV